MTRPNYMTTIRFPYGSITFPVVADFYGEGTIEEGITQMLKEMYPAAASSIEIDRIVE